MSEANSPHIIASPRTPLEYDFIAPQKIVFGWGRRKEIGSLAASLGRRAFVVVGSKTLEQNGTVAESLKLLASAGVEAIRLAWRSGHEPEVHDVDLLTEIITKANAGAGDLMVGLGGGSAIDLAKAVAAMATNRESKTVADYLEGVGRGLKITNPPLPMLAMPTTAGTGSEATKNAVIGSSAPSPCPLPKGEGIADPPFKKSLRSEMMIRALCWWMRSFR